MRANPGQGEAVYEVAFASGPAAGTLWWRPSAHILPTGLVILAALAGFCHSSSASVLQRPAA